MTNQTIKKIIEEQIEHRIGLFFEAKEKALPSLKDVKTLLGKVDAEYVKKIRKIYGGKSDGDDVANFNVDVKDLKNGYFSYEFDGYDTVFLKFNSDGSISAWFDMDFKDVMKTKPDLKYKNDRDMIKKASDNALPQD